MAQALSSRKAGQQADAAAPVVLSEGESSRFLLMHHPNSWEVVDLDAWGLEHGATGRYEVVPELRRLRLRPGVNGVRAAGKRMDKVSYDLAVTQQQRRGWQVIDPTEGPGGDYVEQTEWAYHDAWTQYVRAGDRYIPRTDVASYIQWRRDLVTRGIVEPPQEWALERIRAVTRHTIGRLENQAHIPRKAEKLEDEEEKLAAIAEASPTPVKRKPRRRKKPSTTEATDG